MSKFNEFELEQNLAALAERANSSTEFLDAFPLEILRAYQVPAAQIARIEKDRGPSMLARNLTIPKQIVYQPATPGKVHDVIAQLKAQRKPGKIPGKSEPRFLVSTDGHEIAAVDLKLNADFKGEVLADLPIEYDFFHPMFGVERYVAPTEQKVDVDAARVMRELHNAFTAHDPEWEKEERLEALNTFMVRLLFCLFADGAGVFDRAYLPGAAHAEPFEQAMEALAKNPDGSQTAHAITQAFKILDLPENSPMRQTFEPRYRKLPYANGRLFEKEFPVPTFNGRAQRAFKRALGLDWSEINADIFGSMIQAIAQDEERSSFGMHYTSVPNIMKVLGPLFLDELKEQLAAAGKNPKRLQALIDRISGIHIFDPAAGSGNFLIIAYRELRAIETAAMQLLQGGQMEMDTASKVKLDHFHGIDPNDFACRTARLSLWISQIQADRRLAEIGIKPPAILPLHDAGDIRQGSALEIDWLDVVPAGIGETYIVGNPPYLGSTYQSKDQKASMDAVFADKLKNWRNLDFVATWFCLATQHIKLTGSKAAMVTTNSLCQGESVPTLWPWILKQDVEIGFAHTSFKWTNSAANNAGVACIIVGLQRNDSKGVKSINAEIHGTNGPQLIKKSAKNINPYLVDGDNIIVKKASKPLNGLPEMIRGNQPTDGGYLLLNRDERETLLSRHPEAARLLRPIMGSKEFIRSEERWCLWIEDKDLEFAMSLSGVAERINSVRQARLSSPDAQAQAMAERSHQFREMKYSHKTLLMTSITSEKRAYLQCGMISDTVTSNRCFAVLEAPNWLIPVLSSSMHMAWTRTVGGSLEERLSYLNTIVYNTFPTPNLTESRKAILDSLGLQLIAARQPYIDDGRNIAWIYDTKTMPSDVLAAHQDIDEEFESMYIGRNFSNDDERVSHLLRLYAMGAKK